MTPLGVGMDIVQVEVLPFKNRQLAHDLLAIFQ